MGFIGLLISLAAVVCMAIGLIPFLGWFNWITTLPLAFIGAIISAIAINRQRSILGIAGLVLCAVVFLVASMRLFIGCGII
jgi:hypothetical protein